MKPETRQKIRRRVEEKLRPLTLPNFITLTRMAMVPFFALAVWERDFSLALWILIIAGLTDAFDGYLARRMDMQSLIGAYLDPIADKMLITVAYIALTIPLGQEVVIPLWLTILALFRDFVIMLMAGVLYIVEGLREFPPSPLGKATTGSAVSSTRPASRASRKVTRRSEPLGAHNRCWMLDPGCWIRPPTPGPTRPRDSGC
jgi:cardiolipin synthase